MIAVDADVDITRDSDVLWAMFAHFQPHKDVVIIEGLPGNALDPSASGIGTTSRMGLDATAGLISRACSPGSTRLRSTALRRFSRNSAVLKESGDAWR